MRSSSDSAIHGRFRKDKSPVFLVENYGSGVTPIIFTQLRAIPLAMTENSIR